MQTIENIRANSGGFDKETTRAVIFNADDLGLNRSVNEGIIAAHRNGVVRSTSLMITGDACAEAIDYARENPSLDLGLHLALCEVRPACKPGEIPSLVTDSGSFCPNFTAFLKRHFTGRLRAAELEKELRAQVEKALATGLPISHLDSHQHLHALPSIFKIVLRLAEEYRIPAIRCPDESNPPAVSRLRRSRLMRSAQRIGLSFASRLARPALTAAGIGTPNHFLGFMEMGLWCNESLQSGIAGQPPGLVEVCCHPRSQPEPETGCDFPGEITALTSGELKQFLEKEKIRVTSFRECFGRNRAIA